MFRPLLPESYRYYGVHGGRGSGKSWFFANKLVRKAVLRPNQRLPGLRWLCVREVQKSLDESVKHLIETKIQEFGFSHLFEIKANEIITPGNPPGVIIFPGMQNHTAHTLKSYDDFDGAWFEEAQAASNHSLKILRPTIRKPGSQLWFSWNPESEGDPIDQLLRGPNVPPRSIVVQANWMDNPYFPDVLKEEKDYALKHNRDDYAHIWLGDYRKLSRARVFSKWRIAQFDTPLNARFLFGADWGYANDPTVLIRCFVDEQRRFLFVDYEARKVGCEVEDTPALFDQVPGSRRWKIRADSSRPEMISYMRRQGFYIEPALKGPGSVEEGIEWLKNYTIIVHPRCEHLPNELTLYSWKVDKKTEDVLPILEDKNNHDIDALRYSCEGLIRKIMPISEVL